MARRRGQDGASAIEMAFIAPAFLLLIFGIIEVALWMHARDVALAAAREGVSSLRTVQSESSSAWEHEVEVTAQEYADSLGDIRDPKAKADFDEGDQKVTVEVSGGVIDLLPGFDLSVSASASGYIEDFRPDLGNP